MIYVNPATLSRVRSLPSTEDVRDGDPLSDLLVPGTPWRLDVERLRVVLADAPDVVVPGATRAVSYLRGYWRDAESAREAGRRLTALYQGVGYEDVLAVMEVMND